MTTALRTPARTRTIRLLTPEELKALLGVIRDKRDRAIFFLVAYRHGLRASEMGLLRTNDLDLKGLRLMLHRLKGSHAGEHPETPTLRVPRDPSCPPSSQYRHEQVVIGEWT